MSGFTKKNTNLSKHRIVAIALGLALVVLAVLVQLGRIAPLQELRARLELMAFDVRMLAGLPAEASPDPRIVIVDIDEPSLQREGRWPWSRDKVAALVEAAVSEGATVVAFDVMFTEPERNVADAVLRALEDSDSPALVREAVQRLTPRFDTDARLAEILGEHEVVLGFLIQPAVAASIGQLPEPLELANPEVLTYSSLPPMHSFTATLPVLQQASGRAGFVSLFPDVDGIVRRAPLVARHEEQLYGSLALEALRLFLLLDEVELVTAPIGGVQAVEGVRLGAYVTVPTDSRGGVIVPFRGRQGSFPYVSATDVLRGKAPAGILEDAIVLVGTTAPGLFDLRATPVQSVYPGVEVHANLIAALLDGEFLVEPPWARGANVAVLVLVGVLLAVLLPLLAPLAQLATGAAAAAGVVAVNAWFWNSQGLVLALAGPLALVVALAGFNVAYGFLFEARAKHRLKGMFGQYVPPELVDEMSRRPDAYGFEGETRELTVLFADVRNFTTISESLSASDLKRLLNRYFTPMTRIIFNARGTIDKYVGDMIMAFWGAPLPDQDHAAHAIEAALQMLAETERMRAEFAAEGLPEISIGVGLNTGLMNVGDMGSEYRRAYTVLGDAVNLASRLEGTTKYYGVGLVVGERTRAAAGERFLFRELDLVKVKGKAQAIRVYQPVCRAADATEALREELDRHHQALALYRGREWTAAREAFAALQAAHPDTLIYAIYLQRVAELRDQRLGSDWDGVYERTTK